MTILKFPEVYRYTFVDFLAERWPQGHPLYVERTENGLTLLSPDQVWVSKEKWTFWSIFELFPATDPPAVWIKSYGHYDTHSYLLPQTIFRARFLVFQEFKEEYARLEEKRAHYLYNNMQDSVSYRSTPAFASQKREAIAFSL